MTTINLLRLENTIWRYTPLQNNEETSLDGIQINTPPSDDPKFGYILAQAAAQLLQSKNISKVSQLEEEFSMQLENTLPSTLGRWKISLIRHNSWVEQIMNAIPAAKRIYNRKIADITVTKENEFLASFLNPSCSLIAGDINQEQPNSLSFQTQKAFFDIEPFSDPFTRLSAAILQTVDPRFVSERKIYAFHRFVLSENGQALHIKQTPDRPPTNEEIQENIRTVTWYRNFIIEEYGIEKLQFVDAVYGFSLAEMIQQGLPLAPDHVFKVNIGMNKIGFDDIKTLFEKLRMLCNPKEGTSLDPTKHFPRYQMRKLAKALNVPSPTIQQLVTFADPLRSDSDIRNLPKELFNQLVDLVLFSPEERERAYTGRKIYLWAISGTVTLGDSNVYNPSSDLFDVLQIFSEFEKTDNWENYSELLTHIIVKKALYEPMTDKDWKVGLLLAGPKAEDGSSRWFYLESFCDDNLGNVNYLLLPACNNYTLADGSALPLIKAYRSTSSAQNCIDWAESIVADLNPFGSPGSLDPQNSFPYEKTYFDERTIPVWVGYLLLAKKKNTEGKEAEAKGHLKQAVREYHFCLHAPAETTPEQKLFAVEQHYTMTHISSDFSFENTYKFLEEEALFHKELPQNKIAAPLFFIGHSLGAALSQFYTYYYTSRRHRIPLPGQDLFCYASRGPGIDNYQDENFMQFGREHRNLLTELNQTWHVRHDFEYGDFTPQAGQSHLGTTKYDQTLDTWIDPKISVFKPLDTAEALGITTFPTHARRTGMAEEDRDFEMRTLTVQNLQVFDHAWVLPSEIRDIFGFLLLQSSKVTEAVRQVFAFLTRPAVMLAMWIYRKYAPLIGPRDENGVLFLRYTKPIPVT